MMMRPASLQKQPISVAPRYRVHEGLHIIDLQATSEADLFEAWDPSPVEQRRLHSDLVRYLTEAVEEVGLDKSVQFNLYLHDVSDVRPAQLIHAMQHHFAQLAKHARAQLRRAIKQGHVVLALGVFTGLLLLRVLTKVQDEPSSSWHAMLQEGLTVLVWVALWRPIEIALFEWWPLLQRTRLYRKLASSQITIHHK